MLRLMKYELRKTQNAKLVMVAISVLLQVVYLYGLYAKNDTCLSIGVTFLTMMAVLSAIIIGLISLLTLHKDMNTKQSYMLFMTPNSSYKILGAKMLECALSILIITAYFLALGVLDVTLLAKEYGMVNGILDFMRVSLSHMGVALQLNFQEVASFCLAAVTGWLFVVSAAAFAEVVAAALLNGKKINEVLSFLVFVVIVYAFGWLGNLLPGEANVVASMLIGSGMSIVAVVAMYIATAAVMEKYLSV